VNRGLVAAALSIVALAGAPAVDAQVVAPLAPDGAWCWFQDPRAVYADGRTYTGYVTAAGDIGIASYDYNRHELRRSIVARAFQRDDHAAPALHVLPDGRVMALWSAHRGKQMYYRVTKRPGDVFDWGNTRVLGTNAPGYDTYTYANPLKVGRRLYVFWRAEAGASAAGQAAYTSSDDGGDTWEPGRVLLQNATQRPYVKYDARGDTIHVAYTEGHPNATQTGVRYAAFRDGHLYRADGTLIADPPIAAARGESVYRGKPRAWVWDVASDSEGRPVIVYATFPTKTDHRYRYARWNGSRWIDVQLARAGGSIVPGGRERQYSGGIALDHGDPSTVYLSRKIRGVFEIERWRTPNRGRTWTRVAVTSRSAQDNVRPVAPRGAHADGPAPVLWMSGAYPSYMSFSTGLRARFDAAPVEVLAPAPDPQTPPPAPGSGPGDAEPPVPEPEGPPPEDAREPGLRLKVSRAVIHPGQRVRITGTMFDVRSRALLDGRTVLVYLRGESGGRWRRTAVLRSNAQGEITLKRTVRRTTDFVLVYNGSPLMAPARSQVARVYTERRRSPQAARD
jgi:hypothetical protein